MDRGVPDLNDVPAGQRWFGVPAQPVSTMENYWEISHYRQPVGTLVLARMMNWPEPRLAALPDFGRLMTAETLATEPQRLAAERARWKGQSSAHDR